MPPTINHDLRGTLPYCTSPIPDVGTKYLQLTYRTPFDGIFVTIAPWLDESNNSNRQWSSIFQSGETEKLGIGMARSSQTPEAWMPRSQAAAFNEKIKKR